MTGGSWTLELWSAVIASGVYHGLNPGMGWPLALSAALMERSTRALLIGLWALAMGHLAAMAVILLPFALLTTLVAWVREVKIAAALAVIAFGVFSYVDRRHPKFLARIPPSRVALWSFAVAMAHGAGLMLVPVYLGLCTQEELGAMGLGTAGAVMAGNISLALSVSLAHTAAMVGAGGAMAFAAYRTFGLKLISRSWFNTGAAWALSLILTGLAGLAVTIG